MSKKKLLLFNTDKARLFAFLFFLVTSAILFYLCKYLFFYDEDIFVVNPQGRFMSDFTRASVIKLSFLADNFLSGANPLGYHITNILLHLCNTLLATYIFRLLLKFTVLEESKARNAYYIFFFLFLLSPVHSEPLCYLLGRAGSVVTLFCLLSLLFFLKANFKNTAFLIISLTFFLLALFSYEISWTFPVIILLIANYLKQYRPLRGKTMLIYVAPFFAVFLVWFLVKVALLNQLKITPYGNDVFLLSDPLRLAKNMLALLFRNVLPPFENTVIFVVLSVITATILVYIFMILKRKNIPLLFFALLIAVSCLLAYLPALVFGISSHNSESERYIYFSSVFAIMFLALAISILRNQQAKKFVVIACCCIYAYFLFATINKYIQGGKLSADYLRLVEKEQADYENVYLLNQPSQYKGVLLFRANSDQQNSSQKTTTTLQDFMYNLYKRNRSEYITLSKKEISTDSAIKNLVRISVDNLPFIFSGFYLNKEKNVLVNPSGDSTFFDSRNSIIVGLKQPTLYIFK